jgi:tetratricopeptide (TPR) repeat protein
MLEHFWRVRGHLVEGRRWLAEAVTAASAAPPLLASDAWNAIGRLAVDQDDVQAATLAFEQGLVHARRSDDPIRVAVPLANLGLLAALYRHDVAYARERFEEAVTMFREVGDASRAATALLNLGTLALVDGDGERAVELLEESLAEATAADDAHSECSALAQLARAHLACGRPEAAAPLLDRTLVLAAGIGAQQKVAQALDAVAALAAARGGFDEAALFLGAAAAARGEIGARRTPDQRAWLEALELDVRDGLGAETYGDAYDCGRRLWLTDGIAGVQAMAAGETSAAH